MFRCREMQQSDKTYSRSISAWFYFSYCLVWVFFFRKGFNNRDTFQILLRSCTGGMGFRRKNADRYFSMSSSNLCTPRKYLQESQEPFWYPSMLSSSRQYSSTPCKPIDYASNVRNARKFSLSHQLDAHPILIEDFSYSEHVIRTEEQHPLCSCIMNFGFVACADSEYDFFFQSSSRQWDHMSCFMFEESWKDIINCEDGVIGIFGSNTGKWTR